MESAAIDYAMKALYLVLMLSMPPIIVASLIGILLSLIQRSQLQEQTLTFGVKLLAVV
ncbi:MAG: EscS/YscS/HrcS family type III secretion system export apparatus protein [Bilophila wadsworthia]